MTGNESKESKRIERLFTLFGDMPADKAHKEIKQQELLKEIPKRDIIRQAWRDLKVKDIEVKYYETDDGRRFMSRQGRYRYCKRTGANPIRNATNTQGE